MATSIYPCLLARLGAARFHLKETSGWPGGLLERFIARQPVFALARWGAKVVVAEVRVELKKGVADPEGANVKKTLITLGFSSLREVQSVKTYRITLEEADPEAAERDLQLMCEKLLANPVVNRYSIKILE
jgi:phosphoribosylformylglycinamidine synthase subunit PurS